VYFVCNAFSGGNGKEDLSRTTGQASDSDTSEVEPISKGATRTLKVRPRLAAAGTECFL
jgi:hypothetical protein